MRSLEERETPSGCARRSISVLSTEEHSWAIRRPLVLAWVQLWALGLPGTLTEDFSPGLKSMTSPREGTQTAGRGSLAHCLLSHSLPVINTTPSFSVLKEAPAAILTWMVGTHKSGNLHCCFCFFAFSWRKI